MKIRKVATLGLAAALMLPAIATAQTFTVESERSMVTDFGTPPTSGPSYFGSHSTGKSKVTMADGTTIKGTWECISMSQPPGIFAMHVMCENKSKAGNFTTVMGCNPLPNDNGMTCNGGMRGKTGDYEGKTGAVNFHLTGGKANGTGLWH